MGVLRRGHFSREFAKGIMYNSEFELSLLELLSFSYLRENLVHLVISLVPSHVNDPEKGDQIPRQKHHLKGGWSELN